MASRSSAPLVASLVLLLAACPLAAEASASRKVRPVMKVVRLLEDMEKELQAGLEDDKKVHEMLHCWCKTNDEEKTAAIAAAEAKSAQLEADMDGAVAKIKELEAKRKATQEEQYANQKALDEAEELRMKENKAFHAEETDLLEAIDAAEYSIEVLSKHHTGFAQVRSAVDRLNKARVGQLISSANGASSSSLQAEQMEALRAFMASKPAKGQASFLSIPGFQSYAPQSGQIFGILEQLKKDFSDSLKAAQEEELKSKTEFETMKAAKLEQIATAKKIIIETDGQIAELKEKHAALLEEYEDTQYQLGLDREFLADLKKKCAVSDAEFAKRVEDRTAEIAAVEDTIKILNTDEMFDVSEATVNKPTVFLQQKAESRAERLRRSRAAEVLKAAAGRNGAALTGAAPAQLVMLAASAQLDAFTKVKAAIDKMVEELTKQNAEEIQHRDWCIENLNTNTRDTEKAYDKKASLEAKIADLTKTIKQLTEDIAASTKAIAEMQQQMKTASEVREAENADYQQSIADQRLTQMILTKALARISEVYNPTLHNTEETRDVGLNEALLQQQPGAAHIATSGTHTDAGNGPAAFKKYEENPGGKRVVALLDDVIAESKAMDDELMKSEEDGQTAYEEFMKQSNQDITAHQTAISNMSEAKAKAEEALSLANADFATTMKEIEDLHNLAMDLHKSCDYILNNFDARQAARTAEIEALREAKNILSGMK